MSRLFRAACALLVAAFALNGSLYAESLIAITESFNEVDMSASVEKIVGDKVYLKPGTVYVVGNKLYVLSQEQLVSFPAVGADEQGLFVSLSTITARHYSTDWTCEYCGTENSNSHHLCRNCDKPRPEKN